jgi:DNA-directed RNA polymerase II subunit RPB1
MPHGDTSVNLPVNLRRLILNAQTKFNIKPHRPGYTNLNPTDVVKKVRCRCASASLAVSEVNVNIHAPPNPLI